MVVTPLRAFACAVLGFALWYPSADASARGVATARLLNQEPCPARVGTSQLHGGGIVAFNLAARQSRIVTASLEMETDQGWFTFNIPPTALLAHSEQRQAHSVTWTTQRVASAPLYLRLPHGSSQLVRAWVTSAYVLTAHDPWHTLGRIACAPYVPDQTHPIDAAPERPFRDLTPDRTLAATVPTGATLITAQPIAAPIFSCAHPFEGARVRETAHIWMPGDAPRVVGVSRIIVMVMPSGTYASTRVYEPAGTHALDNLAQRAARETTYAPARFLCEPAVGRTTLEFTFGSQR